MTFEVPLCFKINPWTLILIQLLLWSSLFVCGFGFCIVLVVALRVSL